jgi:hypothetical protein
LDVFGLWLYCWKKGRETSGSNFLVFIILTWHEKTQKQTDLLCAVLFSPWLLLIWTNFGKIYMRRSCSEQAACKCRSIFLAYNPSYSACFFDQNSIFLSQKISQQFFSRLIIPAERLLKVKWHLPYCSHQVGLAGIGAGWDRCWLISCAGATSCCAAMQIYSTC